MTPPPWLISHTACLRYCHVMRWQVVDVARARDELTALVDTAGYRQTDQQGRELWRCSKRLGRGLRCVVDPRVPRGQLPALCWVGHGVPPRSVWASPDVTP
jgi:hypothetical protein